MRLRGANGSELELSIAGYQFPESENDPWDSNWLLVSVRVVAPEGTWEVTDPCLTTWEARHLVRWLTAAATAPPGLVLAGFSEPNLTVVIRPAGAGGLVGLRACFELELRPPWARASGGGRLCVDLDVERRQLVEAAGALSAQLGDYPLRGDDPTL